jgi:hypothetical protein
MEEIMKRVHKLPKGVHIAPMPPLLTGTKDKVLPGGYAPVSYRSCTHKWGMGNQQHGNARTKTPRQGAKYEPLEGYINTLASFAR